MRKLIREMVPIALLGTVLSVAGCGSDSGSGSPSAVAFLVSVLAGSSEIGTTDGMGTAARFHNPVNVAVDSNGTLFVADFDSDSVRKVSTAGAVTTLTSQSDFSRPFGITFAPDGSLYVETDANDSGGRDSTTGTIWKISKTTGIATVVARNIGRPRGLTVLPDGRLVLVDLVAGTVRLMDPATATITDLAGTAGVLGFEDATGPAAKFDRPYGAAILPSGNILLADQNNNRLREVSLTGVVTTYAGAGPIGSADGARLAATFNRPEDVAIDAAGNIYVDDHDNQTIRLISPAGTVTTIAGGLPPGFVDGVGTIARFFGQEGIALSPDGNTLYIADGTGGDDSQLFNRVRMLNLR